jgi:predicted CoA-substrate-specific enzyme activase
MKRAKISVALDIGSSSIKALAFDEAGNIAARQHQPILGQLSRSIKQLLLSLASRYGKEELSLVALTGSNSESYGRLVGLKPVPEIIACYWGARRLVPNAGALLEIGAEQAKFLRLRPSGYGPGSLIEDISTNSLCSAGTGSFLTQEAHRLGLTLEELGRRALLSRRRLTVAGRCAVFAKTDLVHQHQNGVPLDDLAHALCRMIVQNACTGLIREGSFRRPLVLLGGVAANAGIQEILREILGLQGESLIVPADHQYGNAWGAYLVARKEERTLSCSLGRALEKTDVLFPQTRTSSRLLMPLSDGREDGVETPHIPVPPTVLSDDLFLGIDIGSTTTNLVCLGSSAQILFECSVQTKGQALSAVFSALDQMKEQGGIPAPRGVGVTGSGRRLIAEIIGADLVVNEISAHAAGCVHYYPETDTVFDIGGQDSKYISLRDGAVAAFEMNKTCSAGTGSFLEEMAALLGLDIKREFAKAALSSLHPADLGERCTVFMASEIMRRLQEGCPRADLAAGLSYSVARNYLARVVGRQKISDRISFQGGVASNLSVVRALENLLQKPVRVHKHNEIAGALGAALLCQKEKKTVSRFRGFQSLKPGSVKMHSFECGKCNNRCSIFCAAGTAGTRFFSGGICDRYETKRAYQIGEAAKQPDTFAIRETALIERARQTLFSGNGQPLGVPRALLFHELMPFWLAFFNELQVPYKISEPTSGKTLQKGAAVNPVSPCLPLKIAFGHCRELADRGVERIFVPSIANLGFCTKPERLSHVCSAIQAWPFLTRALFPVKTSFLTPVLRFATPHVFRQDMVAFGHELGFDRKETLAALESGLAAQEEYYARLEDEGRSLLSGLRPPQIPLQFLSRPYLIYDSQVQLRMRRILSDLGVVPFLMEMMPGQPQGCKELDGMYWYFGKRFVQAARRMKETAPMPVVHLSAFGCGADSFLVHSLRRELRGRPLLELEIDEHMDFSGLQTRLEAFLSSLTRPALRPARPSAPPALPPRDWHPDLRGKTLLIPQMSDHAFAFAGAFRSCGINARVLPLPDEEAIFLGRQAMSGQECLPCAFVTGDMLKCLKSHDIKVAQPALFMISGDGPCRLGQYPYLMRQVLDDHGHQDIPLFNASQDQTFYDQLGIVSSVFKRRAWQGSIAVDLLFRKWRECRPYADDRADLDETYQRELQRLCRCVEQRTSLSRALSLSFDHLEEMLRQPSGPRPKVAVLGENYVRCNAAANGRIADALEEHGMEVLFPSLYEWIYYTNWTARLHCFYERQPSRSIRLWLTDVVQHRDERVISRYVKRRLRNNREPSIRKMFRLAGKYIPRTFEGETIIAIARTIDFYQQGASGVVHVVPLGCIAGTIVEALSKRISQDLGGFPVTTIRFDGRSSAVPQSQLEAFLVQMQSWKENHRP